MPAVRLFVRTSADTKLVVKVDGPEPGKGTRLRLRTFAYTPLTPPRPRWLMRLHADLALEAITVEHARLFPHLRVQCKGVSCTNEDPELEAYKLGRGTLCTGQLILLAGATDCLSKPPLTLVTFQMRLYSSLPTLRHWRARSGPFRSTHMPGHQSLTCSGVLQDTKAGTHSQEAPSPATAQLTAVVKAPLARNSHI